MCLYADFTAIPRPHAVTQISGGAWGTITFSFDANGNLTQCVESGGTRTESYTSFNMLSLTSKTGGSTNTLQFLYGAEHQRVKEIRTVGSTVTTTHYVHPDNQGGLLYEMEVSGAVTKHKHYINAAGGVIALHITGTATSTEYWHKDNLGSVAVITDTAGTVTTRRQYDSWGKVTGSSADGYRGYTGHEHFDSLGIIHMNGRTYIPGMGRFMSADPFIQDADNLQSFNRYSYVNNNPLIYTDPSGYLKLGKIFRAVAAVAVAYFTYGAVSSALISSAANAAAASATLSATTTFATAGVALEAGALTSIGAFTAGAAAGFTGGLVASGGDFDAAFKGALTGGLTAGLTSFLPSGTIEDMIGGGVNGFLQTGNSKGLLRGFAAGAIPQDLYFKDAYLKSGPANIAIGIARDGVRGGIVGGRDGILKGIALGQSTNAFGHIYGFAVSGQAPKFRDGAFHYHDTGPFIGSLYGAITFGNTVSGPEALFVNKASEIDPKYRWLDRHERGHVYQARWLGGLYLPAQAASQWIGNSLFGPRGAFLEWGPLHPLGYETEPR